MKILLLTLLTYFALFPAQAQSYQAAEILNLKEFQQNIRYPIEAKESGISGKVLVRVWANADSTVTLDRILKSPDTLLSQEVISKLRVLKVKPGIQNGQFIQEGITFPVQFQLQEDAPSFISQMNLLNWITLPSGLSYSWIDSTGAEPLQKNKMAAMHYIGFLENGFVFDTSKKGKNKPFLVLVGKTRLIQGWEEALTFLAPGDRVWLRIPSNLAYGNQDMEGIPANSTLYFDLEILKEP